MGLDDYHELLGEYKVKGENLTTVMKHVRGRGCPLDFVIVQGTLELTFKLEPVISLIKRLVEFNGEGQHGIMDNKGCIEIVRHLK